MTAYDPLTAVILLDVGHARQQQGRHHARLASRYADLQDAAWLRPVRGDNPQAASRNVHNAALPAADVAAADRAK